MRRSIGLCIGRTSAGERNTFTSAAVSMEHPSTTENYLTKGEPRKLACSRKSAEAGVILSSGASSGFNDLRMPLVMHGKGRGEVKR